MSRRSPGAKRVFSTVAIAFLFTATAAHTQDRPPDYPKKPIRVIVGIAPGGGLDATVRLGALQPDGGREHSAYAVQRRCTRAD